MTTVRFTVQEASVVERTYEVLTDEPLAEDDVMSFCYEQDTSELTPISTQTLQSNWEIVSTERED